MFKTVSIQLERDSVEPLYLQLFNALRDAIISGALPHGQRLPSVRKLIQMLHINNATVTHAFRLLLEENLVRSAPGSGYYVTYQRTATPVFEKPVITVQTRNLASTTPPKQFFPAASFSACINETLAQGAAEAFSYGETWGYYPLRETLSALCQSSYGITAPPEQIMIVSGAQQGLDVIARCLLRSGDTVLLENPCYNGAKLVFESRGAHSYGVPLTADGMDLEELERLLRLHHPKLLYVSPNYQTPTTICYSQTNKKQLLTLAQQYNCTIVEEDSVSDIRFTGRRNVSLKSMDVQDNVVYIKSFSKILMPGVRSGFLIVPQTLVPQVSESKFTADVTSPGLFSRALHLFLTGGEFARHLETVIPCYQKRYTSALHALAQLEPLGVTYHKPNGGLAFWLSIPRDVGHIALYHKLLAQDIVTAPGDLYTLSGESCHLRVCYASLPPEQFSACAKQMAAAIRTLRQPERNIVSPFII
ncbi:MAG: PLP-dependent aminotransferase family protein [Clostridia bacterium]|nr:PLP-dependent aminotransferase family protein [Clostridia bacterium]